MPRTRRTGCDSLRSWWCQPETAPGAVVDLAGPEHRQLERALPVHARRSGPRRRARRPGRHRTGDTGCMRPRLPRSGELIELLVDSILRRNSRMGQASCPDTGAGTGRTGMRRHSSVSILSAIAVAAGLALAVVPAGVAQQAAPDVTPAGPTVYVGDLTPAQFGALRGAGLDREDISDQAAVDGKVGGRGRHRPRAGGQAGRLGHPAAGEEDRRRAGLAAAGRGGRPHGLPVLQRARRDPRRAACRSPQDNPALTKLVPIGTHRAGPGRSYAVKVTKNARQRQGRLPAGGALLGGPARPRVDHPRDEPPAARTTSSTATRTDPQITQLVDTTELWFVPVANPDGYDFTFTDGKRLWRKNLRDNNGDGVITGSDGVDLEPQLPDQVGLRQRGLVADPRQRDLPRHRRPASEPETQALDGLLKRIGFEFLINYHSAAELLLYGVGWQVATPSPDDVIYEAHGRRRRQPGRARLRPRHLGRALHDQRRDHRARRTTPTARSAYTPGDVHVRRPRATSTRTTRSTPADCESVFNFPDSEALIQAEFEKNIPFALAVAESAHEPGAPGLGGRPDRAGLRRRHLRRVLRRPADRGRDRPARAARPGDAATRSTAADARTSATSEWKGGERYGDEGDDLLRRVPRRRARAPGRATRVEVWFTGQSKPRRQRAGVDAASRFTYRLAQDTGAQGARDRRRGLHRRQPDTTRPATAPKYVDARTSHALAGAGLTPRRLGRRRRRACRTTSAC